MLSTQVQVIDLFEPNKNKLAAQINAACTDCGYFLLVNHQVPVSLQKATRQAAKRFFKLPSTEKANYAMNLQYPYGYLALGKEILAKTSKSAGDSKESFTIGPYDPRAGKPEPIFPKIPNDLEEYFHQYYQAMERVSNRLLHGFALALGLSPNWFKQKTNRHTSALRALNYPVSAQPKQSSRCSKHTDYGTFTIINSDVAGLQVCNNDGNWVDIPQMKNALVVLVADLLQMWTNDKWRSALHRVVDANTERLSLAFFHNPNDDASIDCIYKCVDAKHPAKYEPIKAGKYLAERHAKSTMLQ
jgi:isopenicillin N synthase-like dioxygenase